MLTNETDLGNIFGKEAENIARLNAEANKTVDTYTNVSEAAKQAAKAFNDEAVGKQLSNLAMQQATASTNGYTAATVSATAAQRAFNVVKGAGNILLNAGVAIIGTMIASALLSWMDDVIHREERIAEAAETAKNNINELNESFQTNKEYVESVIDSYDELAKGVNTLNNTNISLSTEDYQEYLEINDKLVDIFPELYKGLDENGHAILTLGENGKTAAEGLNEALLEMESLNNYRISKELPDLYAGLKLQLNQVKEANEEFKKEQQELQNTAEQMETLSIQGLQFDENNQLSISGSIDDSSFVEYEATIQKIYNEFKNSLSDERLFEIGDLFNLSSSVDEYTRELETIITIPWDQLLEDEKENFQNLIKDYAGDLGLEFRDEIKTAFTQNEETNKELEYAWKDFIPALISTMESKASFQELKDLGDNTQDIVRDIVSNLTPESIENLGEDPYAYIRNTIIGPLSELSETDRSKVNKAFNELLNFDADAISNNPQELQQYVDNLINQIATLLGQNPIDIKVNLGLDNLYVDREVLTESQRLSRQLIEQNTGTSASSTIPEEVTLYQQELAKYQDEIDKLSINTTEETIKWNKALQEALKHNEDLKYAIKVYENTLESVVKNSERLSFGQTITELDTVSEQFDQLDESYAKFADGDSDTNINFDDYKAIQEAFEGIEGIDDYIQKLQEVNGNAKETQQVFDDLATALVDQLDIPNILTEENAGLIAEYLRLKGVINANEIVYGQLSAQQMYNTLAIDENKIATVESIDAIYGQISGLLNQSDATGIATTALYQLVAEQTIFSNSSLNTSQKIQELEKLAKSFGIVADSAKVATAQSNMSSEIAIALRNGDTDAVKAIEDAYVAEIGSYYEDAITARFGNLSASYSGGAATQSAIDKASGSDKDQEETFDWIERRIEVINDRVEKFKNNIDTLVGYKPKNAMTDTAIDLMIEKMDILNQMYDRYMQEASNTGLSQEYINKIQQGMIDIETIQGNETLVNQINEYQEWYDKAQDVKDTIIETQQEIKELNLSKLDNIINQFDQMLDIREQIIDSQQELIDLNDQSGAGVYVDDYLSLIEKQINLANLNAQAFNELNAEMSKMDLQKGSEEWKEYNDQLQDYRSNMISAAQAVEDYKDTITELVYKELNDFKDEMDSINETISTMNNLIGDVNLIDDSGNLTNRGLAQVALYAQQLANAKQEAAEYDEAIQSLDEALRKGLITETEYTEMMQEYTSAQNSAVEATKAARDAIINLVKEGIQAEIDAKKELTDSTIEALQAEQDLHDYQNSIADSQDNISRLERQIAALSNSTDRADIAQRLQLQQELAEAQEELYETQYDHEIEQRTDALNKEYENFEEMKQKEMDELDSNLDKQNAAIEDYLNQVKNNYTDVYDVLKRYGDEYNLTATEDLTTPWISGSDAANVCSDAISEAIANINYEISNIDLSPLYELVNIFNSISEYGGGNGSSSTANFEDISGTGKWQRGQGGRWWYGEEYREDGNYNYASGGTYTIDGKQYNFDDEGYMNTEWQKINGKWYYFDANDGHMVTSTWIPGNNGEYYYLQSDGTMATNAYVPTEDKTGYYYVDDEGIWDGDVVREEELRKKGNVKVAYKKGTLNAKEGTALTDEDGLGSEVIITKHGALRQLDYGDTVFNSDMVKKLWDFAVDPNKFLDGVSGSKVDLSSIKPVQSSVTFSAPLFQIEGGLSSDMVGYIDSKCEWLQKNVGKLAYKDLKNTMLGK